MKKEIIFCWLASFTLILAACNNNPKKEPQSNPQPTSPAEDSTETETNDSVFSRELIDTFNTVAFPGVTSKAGNIDWTRFRMTNTWSIDTLNYRPFRPAKDFYKVYGPYLKYSPDSSMFIDIDSYNIDIEKDKNGHSTATDMGPDFEVSLVNTRSHSKARLLFFGPGSTIADAYWLNDDELILIGVHDQGDSTGKTAAAWKYNLSEKTFYLYELHDKNAVQQIMGSWRKERLKGLGFH